MRSTATMKTLWGPKGQTSKMGWFTFTGGARVLVRKELFPALKKVDAIFVKYGYRVRAGDTGGYNPRNIAGTNVASLHWYGIAIDINWLLNPAGSHLVTNMPRKMVEEIEAITTVDGQQVFRWGGDWNDNNIQDESFYDSMHFETQASPAELAKGLKNTTTGGNLLMYKIVWFKNGTKAAAAYRCLFAKGKGGKDVTVEAYWIRSPDSLTRWRTRLDEIATPMTANNYTRIMDGPYKNTEA